MDSKIILLLILLSRTKKDKSSLKLANFSEYIENIEINPQYTKEKINLAKRLAPYTPLEYMLPINRSIHIVESLIKILELDDFVKRDTVSLQETHIPLEDNRERLSKIANIIQDEMPKSNIHGSSSILESIVSIDKYTKMFELLNIFMKNQNLSKDTDKFAKMIQPMMKGDDQGSGGLDIEKIMNIMSVLNQSKDKEENTSIKEDSKIDNKKKDKPNEN